MAITPERATNEIRFLDDDESHEYFDAQARRLMDMSGEEFLRRFDAGEFPGTEDDARAHSLAKLILLIPFGR